MLMFFFFFSIIFCLMSYLNLDPMKSSFFLIFSLLMSMPLVSFTSFVWYSYFICLLFLSGVFVILVYFSSLSKINFVMSKLVFFSFLVTMIFCSPSVMLQNNFLMFSSFYYIIFWFQFIFLVIFLLMFMNFSSYFLSFSGALRKI